MSAFQLPAEHLGAIVRWTLLESHGYGATWRGHTANPNDAADMLECLAAECFTSVRSRYPNGPLPGPCDASDGPVSCPDTLSRYKRLTPVEVLKACSCYEYQSCEHDGWERSEAFRLIEAIRHAAIAALPGYEDADWEITGGAK